MNQRWKDRRSSWAPANAINPALYEVAPCSERDARNFVEQHHYSGTYPAARFRVGMYKARQAWMGLPELVGVAVFSVPCNEKVIPCYAPGLAPNDGVELGRFVLLDEEPGNAETWFLARAFRALKMGLPAVRFVLSYSDPIPRAALSGEVILPGHIGVIYQAHNGRYFGRGSARKLILAPSGHVLSPRALSKIRLEERGADYAERQLLKAGCTSRRAGESGASYVQRVEAGLRTMRHPGNHVYGWPLDRKVEMRAALPYSSIPNVITNNA